VGRWTRITGHEPSRLEQWFLGHFETTTDERGVYLFDGIDPRPFPELPVHMWATHLTAGVSVIRELLATDETIDFTVYGAGRVGGVVTGLRGGRPLVAAVRGDEPRAARHASLGRTARFQFEDVPPGDYVVSLAAPELGALSSANVTVAAAR